MSAVRSNSSTRERALAGSGSSSRIRLLTLKARHSARLRSLPGGSSLMTSAPRSASRRPASQPSRSVASMINTCDSSMALLFSPLVRGQKRVAKGVYARLRRAMDARGRAYDPPIRLFSHQVVCKGGWIAGLNPVVTTQIAVQRPERASEWTHPTMRERAFSMSFSLKKSSGLTRSTG